MILLLVLVGVSLFCMTLNRGFVHVQYYVSCWNWMSQTYTHVSIPSVNLRHCTICSIRINLLSPWPSY
ncbi:hypothetical protein BDV36DRAFT_260575 [Aspergillus pseudocaelatus]|uniref:Secreted protein n=1 Tax=Aspergillus pseudocaelatus TaxID=1825620 RepID=A0ABQ6WGW4_9EURO|nr:hypothetical protein BDV36DRAFT_260575 [Aspergillus pseudocaelatus]